MTLPATVNCKLLKNVAGVLLTLAVVNFGILGTVQSHSHVNGTYLNGKTAQPNKLGKYYKLFTSQNGKIVGAFYFPRSQFECFMDSLNNNMLNVKSFVTGETQVIERKTKLSDFWRI